MTVNESIVSQVGPSFIAGTFRCRCGNTLSVTISYTISGIVTIDPAASKMSASFVDPHDIATLCVFTGAEPSDTEERSMQPIPEADIDAWLLELVSTEGATLLAGERRADQAFMEVFRERSETFAAGFAGRLRQAALAGEFGLTVDFKADSIMADAIERDLVAAGSSS